MESSEHKPNNGVVLQDLPTYPIEVEVEPLINCCGSTGVEVDA
jgi:hypothetical protein